MEINFNESSNAIIGRLNHPDDIKKYFSSKTFKDFLADKTSPLVYCTLSLDGKEFLSKSSFEIVLNQKTNDHDSFNITVPDDALDSFSGYVLENSKNILGKKITINFHRFGEVKNLFSGVIANIKNKKENGYGKLFITGFAPSILLESGKDCKSFEDKTLEQIIKEVTSEYPEEAKIDASNIVNSSYSIPYTVQYKESDYGFIQRLAKRYGEYFYYNGQQLVFGNKVQPIISLEDGVDLIEAEFELSIKPQDFRYMVYDAEKGDKTEKDSSSTRIQYKENPFQAIAVNASKNVFKKIPDVLYNHTGIGSDTDKALSEAVRREKENRENLVTVTGKSKDPNLKIGGRAKLIDINNKAMETYRIIEIKHFHNGNEYYNEFVGIPDLFNAPYQDNEAFPMGEEQSAIVVDNNDPMGMGRIKVQFPWQEKKGEKTPWLRIATLHTGTGKGTHIIPEIGEEVLVAYESGNAEKPYVSGALYNGAEKSGYHTAGNDLKVVKTRSGTKIIMNDAEGSIFIEDPSGNTYLMDGAGNIKVIAPKNMSFEAGKNMYFTVGKNMITNIGMNKTVFTGMNYARTVGMNYTSSVSGDATTSIKGKGLTLGETELKFEAKETSMIGMDSLLIHSNKNATVNSKNLIEIKGENGTSHSNIADDYNPTEIDFLSDAVVSFRPAMGWKGEYAMDWFRIGDTEKLLGTKLGGDIDYNASVGLYDLYPSTNPGAIFTKDESLTTSLKQDYGNIYNIPWLTVGTETVKYVVPWICAPQYRVITLSLSVAYRDKDNPPKSLVVVYDKNLFKIESSQGEGVNTCKEIGVENDPIYRYAKIPTVKGSETCGLIDEIKITCLTKNNNTSGIKVLADGKDAGFLSVFPNIEQELKIAMISVKADFGYPLPVVSPAEPNKGQIRGKENLTKALQSIGIKTIFTKIELNLDENRDGSSPNTELKNNRSIINGAGELKALSGNVNGKDFHDYLEDEITNRKRDAAGNFLYANHLRVYFVNQKARLWQNGMVGKVGGKGEIDKGICIMYSEGQEVDVVHESLHALGLGHSFSDAAIEAEQKFLYEYTKTDNYMDYGHLATPPVEQVAFWKWQWDMLLRNKTATAQRLIQITVSPVAIPSITNTTL